MLSTEEVSGVCGAPSVFHPRIIPVVFVFSLLLVAASNAIASATVEKKLPFASPIQWRTRETEISLISIVWGPASSPEMISKGREVRPPEKAEFFSDRSYALGLGFRAEEFKYVSPHMTDCSGLVRITSVNGARENPSALTPAGFVSIPGPPCGSMDVRFEGTSTAEYWDFFPVAPDQKEFLFQVLRSGVLPSLGNLVLSFRVLAKDGDIVIIRDSPGIENECSDFVKNFTGEVGSGTEVSLQLTLKGTNLSGTQQYVRIGKTLWLKGEVDSFGNFFLEEQYPQNNVTGILKGRFSGNCRSMSGYFSKPNGSRLRTFEFHEVAVTP